MCVCVCVCVYTWYITTLADHLCMAIKTSYDKDHVKKSICEL